MQPPAEPTPHLIEYLSWWAQIVLAAIAVAAGVVAFLQLRAFKLLEILKLLEGLEIRAARRTVLQELPKTEWWNDPIERGWWETAAADVCASYDVLALMMERD